MSSIFVHLLYFMHVSLLLSYYDYYNQKTKHKTSSTINGPPSPKGKVWIFCSLPSLCIGASRRTFAFWIPNSAFAAIGHHFALRISHLKNVFLLFVIRRRKPTKSRKRYKNIMCIYCVFIVYLLCLYFLISYVFTIVLYYLTILLVLIFRMVYT